MHLVDAYAYANRQYRLDPALKAGLAGLVILLCLALNRPAVSAAALAWTLGLGLFWAGLPARMFVRLLAAEGLFLALAVLGIAVTVTSGPGAPGIRLGPLGFAVLPGALALAGSLAGRALACAAALNLLILTTPLVDLIGLGRRLRLPALLLDLMTLIYRFTFVLLESLEQMRLAQEARLGYAGARAAMRSASGIGSNLFVAALGRSRRLQAALEGRGYDGVLRVLPAAYVRPPGVVALAAGVALTLIGAALLG